MSVNKHIIQVTTKGAKKSQKQIKGVNNGLKNMAKSAAMAAGAYFGARALLGAIKSSIDLFGQQELAEKKLEAALGKTSQALLTQAKALQQVTMFGDETIIEAQAMIAAFTDDEETIKKATQATLDLAAAKGFDLVAAADLVSKSLGSTTNALTRYGVVVTGAVGSTERLDTLTTNVANLFGGQASAQALTMAGSVQQMKNAVGDAAEALGETLAPVVTKIAIGLKSAAESFQNFVFSTTSTDAEKAIASLKELGVDTSALESSMDNLEKNKSMVKLGETFFTVGANMDQVKSLQDEIAILTEEEAIKQEGMVNNHIRFNELVTDNNDLLEIQNAWTGKITYLGDEINRQERENLELQIKNAEKSQEIFNEKVEAISDEIEERVKLQTLIEKTQAIEAEGGKKAEASLRKKTKAQKQIDEATIKGKEKIGNAILANAGIQNLEDTKEGLRTAYGMAGQAYQAFASIPIIGPALGAAAATVALGIGMGYVAKINSAQYGADFVTSGPQMMLVGEGSGPERVQVTPLSDPNINGPQGSGSVTLNISGNVMTDEFVEDTLIGKIREGIRLGENMGI